MSYIIEPSKKIPLRNKTEVLVLGAGPSGISAAVSAARNGAKVTLVEKNGFAGGQATGGLVIVLCGLKDEKEKIIKGFCDDIVNYLESHNAMKYWYNYIIFDSELLKLYFDKCIIENNIDIILNTYVADIILDNDFIKYALIESKSGRQAIEADIVIDCTGDADSLKYCQEKFVIAQTHQVRPVTSVMLVGGLNVLKIKDFTKNNRQEYIQIVKNSNLNINPFHWTFTIDDRFAWFDMSHIYNVDITDTESLTKAEIEARDLAYKQFKFFKQNIPGFKDSYIVQFASLLGIRDSRRVLSKYFITEKDYGKSFEDRICFAPYYSPKGTVGRLEIPYRALLPQRIKNLIIAGRSIGIDHKLIDSIRELPCCFATGQAAGIAAYMALNNDNSVRNINIKILQQGIILQNGYI